MHRWYFIDNEEKRGGEALILMIKRGGRGEKLFIRRKWESRKRVWSSGRGRLYLKNPQCEVGERKEVKMHCLKNRCVHLSRKQIHRFFHPENKFPFSRLPSKNGIILAKMHRKFENAVTITNSGVLQVNVKDCGSRIHCNSEELLLLVLVFTDTCVVFFYPHQIRFKYTQLAPHEALSLMGR